jgi:hypothetical protein
MRYYDPDPVADVARRTLFQIIKIILFFVGACVLSVMLGWATGAYAEGLVPTPWGWRAAPAGVNSPWQGNVASGFVYGPLAWRVQQEYAAKGQYLVLGPPSYRFVTVPIPPLALPPPPPLVERPLPPPPPEQGPPPPPPPEQGPPPLGWLWDQYLACTTQGCLVTTDVHGLNVRATPGGPPTAALVNGTPVLPLQRSGKWILVAPACPLAPIGAWSWTAGVPLMACH